MYTNLDCNKCISGTFLKIYISQRSDFLIVYLKVRREKKDVDEKNTEKNEEVFIVICALYADEQENIDRSSTL